MSNESVSDMGGVEKRQPPAWEYKTVYQWRETDWEAWLPPMDLNKLGREGWELVTVNPNVGDRGAIPAGITSNLMWVFKRLKT